MNGSEAILAEVLGTVIVLAVLGCVAVAREWLAVSLSVRTVPKSKRHRCPEVTAPVQETAARRDAA